MKFLEYYATMDTSTDYVDLQYGIAAARTFAPYQLDQGRVRFADDFNNSSKLGKGEAFNRTWLGYGTLNATPQTVRSDFRQGGTLLRGIQADTRQIYANSMLNSRYSPERSLRDDKKKLRNDTQKSYAKMEEIHGKSEAEAHFWRHAAFVKSVRRACKGGIAMVASHPSYCNVEAKVHFVLDGLGDLGKMARKDKLAADKGGYLAITSSELAFCCRYWNDEKYPLSQVVKFYVNGDRVMPPWEANYRQQGADGTDVYSNQEAWLRYQLTRDLLFQKKPFPVMSGSADPDEFSDD